MGKIITKDHRTSFDFNHFNSPFQAEHELKISIVGKFYVGFEIEFL